ncbi:STAS domain-containing protein [Bacillota bacterium Lsc_1132]
MGLTVNVEVQGETTIFKIKGILDISTNNLIEPYLNNIEHIKILILDFSELEFIDSTGIGSIINIIYLSLEGHFTLKLQGINQEIKDIFETVGVFQILETIGKGGE